MERNHKVGLSILASAGAIVIAAAPFLGLNPLEETQQESSATTTTLAPEEPNFETPVNPFEIPPGDLLYPGPLPMVEYNISFDLLSTLGQEK